MRQLLFEPLEFRGDVIASFGFVELAFEFIGLRIAAFHAVVSLFERFRSIDPLFQTIEVRERR